MAISDDATHNRAMKHVFALTLMSLPSLFAADVPARGVGKGVMDSLQAIDPNAVIADAPPLLWRHAALISRNSQARANDQ